MAKFNKNDDSLVVIIGSGAGGGTLGYELAKKGVKSVILEAGARHEIKDFSNDEWGMFGQISWLDKRTTSGDWRVATDFGGLPSWIVKAVGGSTVHWAGASLRFQPHEWKARTTYGDVKGASLLDWPIDAKEMAPYYAKAEYEMGTTGTNGIPRLPGNNNFKVLEAGAKKLGYKDQSFFINKEVEDSGLVGVILPYITNRYYPEVLTELHEALRLRGYRILLMTTDDSEELDEKLIQPYLKEKLIAIITATKPTYKFVESCNDQKIKVIAYNRNFKIPTTSSVSCDH